MTYDKVSQYGPLPIRILAGIAFIIHGLPKLSNIAGTEHFFANMIGLPAAMALPIGLLEVIGGIALLIGVLTRIASILFIIEMMVLQLPPNYQKDLLVAMNWTYY